MFHHTHVFVGSNLYKSRDPLLFVGCMLPDIAVTKIIKWQGGLHGIEEDKKFFNFIKEKYPEYISLAFGVHAHNVVDDFTHIEYKGVGYAFMNNRELIRLIIKHYGLEEERAKGVAHNYIESAVELLLLQEQHDLQEQIKQATRDIDQKELSKILGGYFNIEQSDFLKALTDFFELFTKYDCSKKESWGLFWADLEKLLSLKDIDQEARGELLDESLSVVKDTYKDFLDYCFSEGPKKLDKYI